MRRTSRLLIACLMCAGCHEAPNLATVPSPPAPSVPARITISGTPAVGVNAGDVYIVARVWDASGLAVGSTVVAFSTSAGTLQPIAVTTDSGGVAQTTLHTTITSTVRAAAGTAVTTIDVTPNPAVVH